MFHCLFDGDQYNRLKYTYKYNITLTHNVYTYVYTQGEATNSL